jgi:hypothetical protein
MIHGGVNEMPVAIRDLKLLERDLWRRWADHGGSSAAAR